MATDDRWPTWAAEQAGTSSGPTVAQALAIAVVLLALAWSPLATADSGQPGQSDQGSLCDQHPAWQVCKDSRERDGPSPSPARP
ncbi:MAG TPA: hypothetical protein VJB61_08625 [Actinomycetota bacterium]